MEFLVLGLVIAGGIGFYFHRLNRSHAVLAHRARFIQNYAFPPELRNNLQSAHGLTLQQSGQVLEGLRQYFLACLWATRGRGAARLGMPSKAVDSAWHDFILMTREYQKFCEGAFGRFLHHKAGGKNERQDRAEAAQTLHYLKHPMPGTAAVAMLGTMPLLFALDRELAFKDGHMYDDAAFQSLDRMLASSAASSGGHGHTSTSSSESGWFESSESSSDGGGSSCSGGSSCGGGGGDS